MTDVKLYLQLEDHLQCLFGLLLPVPSRHHTHSCYLKKLHSLYCRRFLSTILTGVPQKRQRTLKSNVDMDRSDDPGSSGVSFRTCALLLALFLVCQWSSIIHMNFFLYHWKSFYSLFDTRIVNTCTVPLRQSGGVLCNTNLLISNLADAYHDCKYCWGINGKTKSIKTK